MKRINREDLDRYRFSAPQLSDAVWWPLFDFQRVDRLRERHDFFQIPMHGIGMEPKTEADTNLYNAGTLPSGNHFLATGIRVLFVPDFELHRGRYRQDVQDCKRVLLAGALRFQIQNRIYSQGAPLARFPSCLPMFSPVDEQTFRRWLRKRSLLRVQKLSYFEIVPVYIQDQQHFCVSINFDPKQRHVLNAPGRLGVILDGRMIRPVC